MAYSDQNGACNKKTPTSVLAEFCARLKESLPQYETVDTESDPNIPMFTICASALDFTSKGSGRSKIEAKHMASQNLIGKYKIHKSVHF